MARHCVRYVDLYHGVRLRQRVHAVTISRSAVTHVERLPLYHSVRLRQRVHTVTISRSAVTHVERLPLYHSVRLRQRVHTVTISRSAVTHAERLPIEPRSTAHTMGYRRESSRLHIVQPPLCKSN